MVVEILCEDGYRIKGEVFSAKDNGVKKDKIIIINSATAVSRNLYNNYANFLAENGFDVLTYDYRGIADSKPENLRGFKATFTDWGQKDFTAILNYVKNNFSGHTILVLGHSIGGTIIGMSKDCASVAGIINIGAQTSYYKDWGKNKFQLYALWHIVFPMLTSIWGYFPGKIFTTTEDIPKGVIKQWNARKKNPNMIAQLTKEGHQLYYKQYQGKLLTLAIADDPIGTQKAIRRVYDLFTNAYKEIEHISAENLGVDKIGHFGFFSRKLKDTLWHRTVKWFQTI